MSNRRGGQSTGAKLKAVKLALPGWQGYAAWIVQVVKVKAEYGDEIAVEFLKESKRRFTITDVEYKFAESLVKK